MTKCSSMTQGYVPFQVTCAIQFAELFISERHEENEVLLNVSNLKTSYEQVKCFQNILWDVLWVWNRGHCSYSQSVLVLWTVWRRVTCRSGCAALLKPLWRHAHCRVSKDHIFPHAKRASRYSSYISKAVVGIACYCCQFDVRDH